MTYRTHHCAQLRKGDIGANVTLSGWVHVRRDLGGVIFIDLRDREGLTQVVFRPEENATLAKEAHQLGYEDVIQVEGKVAPRAPGMANPVPLDSERLMAETTPTDSEPASRNGLPMAATGSPTRTREELPRGTGCSFSASALTRSTATSANRS